MKKTIITLVVIIIIIGGYFIIKGSGNGAPVDQSPVATETPTASATPVATVKPTPLANGASQVIGKSVNGLPINAYHYGTGSNEVLFVGGVHGGYAWNTVLLAYELKNYLDKNPNAVPANVRVTVIPVLNPDGLDKVVGTSDGNFTVSNVSSDPTTVVAGRFNAAKVDLNRNFDCDWQAKGIWQSRTVSGGSSAFSEPESQAIRDYVENNKPIAVVAWYSAAGGVYASDCHTGVTTETKNLTNTYATASGYKANNSFDFYATTGDMTNWLAKIGTPAIGVLLTNHTDTEWTKNLAGIKAVLNYYSK